MTTFSDRVLLRWAPIATLLAAGAAVGLTVAPRPFGYHDWPNPVVGRPSASVVQVPSPIDPVAAPVRRLAVSRGPAPALRPQPIALASVRLPAAPAQTRRPRTPAPARYRSPSAVTSPADGRAPAPRGDRGAARVKPPPRSIAARAKVHGPPPRRSVPLRLEASSHEARRHEAARPAAGAWRSAHNRLPNRKAG